MPQIPVPVIPKLTIGTAIDIAAVAFLIYQFIMIVRGRRSAHILNGLWILLVVYVVALWTGLDLLRSVLAAMAPYTAIALIVMFQSDIRRFFCASGASGGWGWADNWSGANWRMKLFWRWSSLSI